MIDDRTADAFLNELGLRRTGERVELARLLLDRPGLTPTDATRELARLDRGVDERTAQRFIKVFDSAPGALARLATVGSRWVCWECHQVIGDAAAAAALVDLDEACPVELGGYCRSCADVLGGVAVGESPPRSSRTRLAGMTNLVPIRMLYGNETLLRDVLGSTRRIAGRDQAIAVLAENPRLGPTSARDRLDRELSMAPSPRSIKRYTASLRRPAARLLIGSLGTVGWGCLACSAWGQIRDVSRLADLTPPGFTMTDVRAVCRDCLGSTKSVDVKVPGECG